MTSRRGKGKPLNLFYSVSIALLGSEFLLRCDVTEPLDEGPGSLPLWGDDNNGELRQLQQEVRGFLPHHVHAVFTLPPTHGGNTNGGCLVTLCDKCL